MPVVKQEENTAEKNEYKNFLLKTNGITIGSFGLADAAWNKLDLFKKVFAVLGWTMEPKIADKKTKQEIAEQLDKIDDYTFLKTFELILQQEEQEKNQ